MIDIENDVFNYVSRRIFSYFPSLLMKSEFEASPASFPAATLVEADNSVLQRMRTENIENAATVMYEVNVFSSKASARKSEAKAIADKIDELMGEIGFTRIMRQQVPNLADARVYRIVSRYSAVVGPNGENRFLIYHNYF